MLPPRSVPHTARGGVLRRTTAAGVTTVIGALSVYSHDEEGLQGIGVNPGFASVAEKPSGMLRSVLRGQSSVYLAE